MNILQRVRHRSLGLAVDVGLYRNYAIYEGGQHQYHRTLRCSSYLLSNDAAASPLYRYNSHCPSVSSSLSSPTYINTARMTAQPTHASEFPSNLQSGKHQINLIRGWPNPGLLPVDLLSAAAQRSLSDPAIYIPALQYGPDSGYQPLREALATWLSEHYRVERDPDRICISGGASQNVACILQSFTDPNVTQAVWCISPSYHLVFQIFRDNGFEGRLKATPEDEEGVDIEALGAKLAEFEKHAPEAKV